MYYNRTSPRKPGYDYTTPGTYFITICTKNLVNYFGEVIDGKMVMNALGGYCHNEIQCIESKRKNVEIHEFVVMPNHVHLILVIKQWDINDNTGYFCRDALTARPDNFHFRKRKGHKPVPTDQIVYRDNYPGPTVGHIINTFKGTVTKYANHHHLPFARQGRYHDRIIRDGAAYETIGYYIKKNPERWEAG